MNRAIGVSEEGYQLNDRLIRFVRNAGISTNLHKNSIGISSVPREKARTEKKSRVPNKL
jgi:hypothetical protein